MSLILNVVLLIWVNGCAAPQSSQSRSSDLAQAPNGQTSAPTVAGSRSASGETGVRNGPTGGEATSDAIASAPQDSRPAEAGATFCGVEVPRRVGVVEFEAHGEVTLADAGRIIADRIGPRLSPRWFTLIERSQMAKIRQEQDFQRSGALSLETQMEFGRAANVSHLVLGSVAEVEGVVIDARLVNVSTGRVVRQASATLDSYSELDAALDEIAAVLSAADGDYARIEATRLAAQAAATDTSPAVRRVGDGLEIRFRLARRGKTELVLYRQARQKLRDLYVDYCRGQLGATASKASLVDFCRENEEVVDVCTVGGRAEFVFRVPLPN